MAAAVTEVKGQNGWAKVGLVRPGEIGGSFSDHTPEGRHVYMVTCYPTYTLIQRSRFGVDLEVGGKRAITALGGWVEVAKLERNEVWEQTIKTDQMKRRHRFRVRHVHSDKESHD